VEADTVAVEDAIEVDLAGLKIVWDAGIRERVRVWRARALPAETGGVLLGYFDLTAGKAYIVDALPPPPDSRADPTGFTRGVEGLGRAVAEAQRRTANIVGYVGEWHSHPIKIAARPSIDDVFLLVHLGIALHRDGLPALMLIVGEGDEGWYSAKGRS
jgi:integrative and conjugative element protein (TIGR02256 family)